MLEYEGYTLCCNVYFDLIVGFNAPKLQLSFEAHRIGEFQIYLDPLQTFTVRRNLNTQVLLLFVLMLITSCSAKPSFAT